MLTVDNPKTRISFGCVNALEAELTLAYWDKSQTPTIDANIKSFNETYPNITVTTNLTAYADY